jgi:hypothetical protein
MLPLDHPRWETLRDAYGDGTELAGWLDELTAELRDPTLWDELTSRICHQNTVYTATYAAVPHLVAYAADQSAQGRIEPLVLVGLSHTCSFLDDAPDIPPDLSDAYEKAIEEASRLLPDCLHAARTESEFRYVQAAIAATHGFIDLAFVTESLDCALRCPSCENIIDVMESTLNLHHMRPKPAPSNSA